MLLRLRETARLCEQLFGATSLRLGRVLTELARQYLNLEMDQLLNTVSLTLSVCDVWREAVGSADFGREST